MRGAATWVAAFQKGRRYLEHHGILEGIGVCIRTNVEQTLGGECANRGAIANGGRITDHGGRITDTVSALPFSIFAAFSNPFLGGARASDSWG